MKTVKDVEQAQKLLDILRSLPILQKGLRHKDPKRRDLSLQVHLPEANYITSSAVPVKIARQILALTKRVAKAELKRLGVKVPAKLR